MDDATFEAELERRIALLENPDSGEFVLEDLPARDLWFAIAGLVVLTVVLLWWGYFA